MKLSVYLLLIFSFFACTVAAQPLYSKKASVGAEWLNGYVVLQKERGNVMIEDAVPGDTLYGKIKYHIGRNLVQLKQGDGVHTFSERRLFCFYFFDSRQHEGRIFKMYTGEDTDGNAQTGFFEVLLSGHTELLLKSDCPTNKCSAPNQPAKQSAYNQTSADEQAENEQKTYHACAHYVPVSYPSLHTRLTFPDEVDVDDLYIRKYTGQFCRLKRGHKSVLLHLSDQRQAIELFVRNNNLTYKRTGDLVKIIHYYNSLHTLPNVVTRN